MEDKEIRQIFKNNFDCYADAENVEMAMTEDRFLEVVKQALHKSCVIKSVCPPHNFYYNGNIKKLKCANCDETKDV